MAARKPLVLIDGQTRQLPNGDTLDAASSEVDVLSLSNGGASAAPFGSAIYISADNTFGLARANAGATAGAIALVMDSSIAPAAAGFAQTDGTLTGSTGQWDAVTGESGGLVAGSRYFLSDSTAGHLSRTAPSSSGSYCLKLGVAISATEFEISIGESILL